MGCTTSSEVVAEDIVTTPTATEASGTATEAGGTATVRLVGVYVRLQHHQIKIKINSKI